MLLQDLKRVASNCCFNPRKPDKSQKVVLNVGNPAYWTIKAMELISKAQNLSEGSDAYKKCIQEATSLLILTRAHIDDQSQGKKSKEARNATTGQACKSAKTS